MATFSERVNNCQKTGRYVQTSIEINQKHAAKKVAEQFGGKLAETAIAALLSALIWLISYTTEQLEKAESVYVKEQGDDKDARDQRNEDTLELTSALERLRSRLDALGGDELLESCHMPGALPSQPQRLLGVAKNVTGALKGMKGPIKDELDGSEFHPNKSAAFIEKRIQALNTSLTQVELDKRETQGSLSTRDQAFERWGLVYRCVSAIIEGLYLLAGMEREAAQVRFRQRRRRGEESPSTEPQQASDDTTNSDSPTEHQPIS